jgi:hypothetical protein
MGMFPSSIKKKQRGFTKDYNAHHLHKETGKNRKREKLRTTPHVIPLFSLPVPSYQLRPPPLQLLEIGFRPAL